MPITVNANNSSLFFSFMLCCCLVCKLIKLNLEATLGGMESLLNFRYRYDMTNYDTDSFLSIKHVKQCNVNNPTPVSG